MLCPLTFMSASFTHVYATVDVDRNIDNVGQRKLEVYIHVLGCIVQLTRSFGALLL